MLRPPDPPRPTGAALAPSAAPPLDRGAVLSTACAAPTLAGTGSGGSTSGGDLVHDRGGEAMVEQRAGGAVGVADGADDDGDHRATVAAGRGDEAVHRPLGVARLQPDGAGVALEQLVVVSELVRDPVGPGELVDGRRADGRQPRVLEERPGRDRDVTRAHQVAAADGEVVVEPTGVLELRLVLQLQPGGQLGQVGGERLGRAADPFGQRHPGVVGRAHEQRAEHVLEQPHLAGLHVQVVGGHALGAGAHRHLIARRQGGDRGQRREDLAEARRWQRLAGVGRRQHGAGVGVDQDRGLRRRQHGRRGRRRRRGKPRLGSPARIQTAVTNTGANERRTMSVKSTACAAPAKDPSTTYSDKALATWSMQAVSAAMSSGSMAGNMAMRSWLRPSLR